MEGKNSYYKNFRQKPDYLTESQSTEEQMNKVWSKHQPFVDWTIDKIGMTISCYKFLHDIRSHNSAKPKEIALDNHVNKKNIQVLC